MTRKRNKTRNNQKKTTRPELFSAAIYKVLQDHIRSSENHNQILICMCDYKVCDISSKHSKNEPYSHVIVVCIKFIKGSLFQPIGSLIYQRNRLDESISAIIKMLHMYVETLNELGYVILGSISTCDKIFERIFDYLVGISSKSAKDKDGSAAIIYEIGSTRLVHIFDIYCLYSKFMTKWIEYDIYSYNGLNFGTSSWSYIHTAQKYLFNDFVVERSHLADIALNLNVLDILTRQVITRQMPLEAANTMIIFEAITHLMLLCCSPILLFDIELRKLRILFMNYVIWLQNLCFKKEKSVANISIHPPRNIYFCTSVESSKYYNVYINLKDSSTTEDIYNYALAYVNCILDQEFLRLRRTNFCPEEHLTHIKSEINKGTIEEELFIYQMIQTILGILEIVPYLRKETYQNLTGNLFNAHPIAFFMHRVINEKNKIKTSPYVGASSSGILMNEESAYKIFDRHDGALMVTYNTTTKS